MIFSREKWNQGDEISAYVPASSSLSFSKLKHSLSSAQEMFLLPVLGEKMMETIEGFYTSPDSSTDIQRRVLSMAQRAVANIAFWYDFDALNLRISDQGFQRQGSEDWQGAYKYQEDHLRNTFKNKGFNAIDQLLEYLNKNISSFADFKDSQAYINRNAGIVQSPQEVYNLVYINSSYLVYLRLQNEFETVENQILKPTLGDSFYNQLKGWLKDPSTFKLEEMGYELEDLRNLCATVIIRFSVSRLLRETGSLTDRGLYFEDIMPGSYSNEAKKAASDNDIGDRLSLADKDAELAKNELKYFLARNTSTSSDEIHSQHIRNNDDKQAFFTL